MSSVLAPNPAVGVAIPRGRGDPCDPLRRDPRQRPALCSRSRRADLVPRCGSMGAPIGRWPWLALALAASLAMAAVLIRGGRQHVAPRIPAPLPGGLTDVPRIERLSVSSDVQREGQHRGHDQGVRGTRNRRRHHRREQQRGAPAPVREVATTTAREVIEATPGYGAAIRRGLAEADTDSSALRAGRHLRPPPTCSSCCPSPRECDFVFGRAPSRRSSGTGPTWAGSCGGGTGPSPSSSRRCSTRRISATSDARTGCSAAVPSSGTSRRPTWGSSFGLEMMLLGVGHASSSSRCPSATCRGWVVVGHRRDQQGVRARDGDASDGRPDEDQDAAGQAPGRLQLDPPWRHRSVTDSCYGHAVMTQRQPGTVDAC